MIMIAAIWLFPIIAVAMFIGWQLGAAITAYRNGNKWMFIAGEERARVNVLKRMLHLDPSAKVLVYLEDVQQASQELKKEFK